jgi:hypothetical protein
MENLKKVIFERQSYNLGGSGCPRVYTDFESPSKNVKFEWTNTETREWISEKNHWINTWTQKCVASGPVGAVIIETHPGHDDVLLTLEQ